MTNLTQKWVNGTATNYGVILWATNEDVNGYDLRFRSSEYGTTSDRPYLEVIYSTDAATKIVYFLKDHLGSIRATVQDTIGAPVVGYSDYDPWGYILARRDTALSVLPAATRNKFTGKEWDDEFGVNLYHFPARLYEPQIARWLVRDPIQNSVAPKDLINSPDFIVSSYRLSGFRKYQEFDYETLALFYNDTLVVLYEIVPWQNNIIHVFNLKSGAHFKKKYKRKCTGDGGIEQNFHTRLENGELVTYWGCENDGYRIGLQTLQLEEVNLEAAGITGKNLWKYGLSEELRQAYYSADTSISVLDFSIDSTKFRVHKKYHRLWHLKDSLDNDYLTNGKVTVKLEAATIKIEDWN